MRATSQAQPNIALIKYWGKRDAGRNLPAVGSLSVTLESLWTRMTVSFPADARADALTVNGRPDAGMLPRVSACLDDLLGVGRRSAVVDSDCNFPIAAGLASSASAFAALVVAASHAAGLTTGTLDLARAAGRASGSAARSLYGGLVELEVGEDDIRLVQRAVPSDWPLRVVVAVTERGPKPVGSTEGMTRSAATSPFYSDWVARQGEDLAIARAAVAARDFEQLAAVSEHNCLKMHSVMWTSRPPIVYWNRSTVGCMEAVRDLQRAGHGVFFTIDAGPQVKAVCLPESETAVREALGAVVGVQDILRTGLGDGARLVQPG